MRQKKSNLVYYIIAALFLLVIGFVIIHEAPLKQEHVEEIVK